MKRIRSILLTAVVLISVILLSGCSVVSDVLDYLQSIGYEEERYDG